MEYGFLHNLFYWVPLKKRKENQKTEKRQGYNQLPLQSMPDCREFLFVVPDINLLLPISKKGIIRYFSHFELLNK